MIGRIQTNKIIHKLSPTLIHVIVMILKLFKNNSNH
jgi:hypothetical protein